MTFAQQRNHLMTHSSEHIPIIKWRNSVLGIRSFMIFHRPTRKMLVQYFKRWHHFLGSPSRITVHNYPFIFYSVSDFRSSWDDLIMSTRKIGAYYIHYNVNGHTEKNNTRIQYHLLRQSLHVSCFQACLFYSGIKVFNSLMFALRSLIKIKAQYKVPLRRYFNIHSFHPVH